MATDLVSLRFKSHSLVKTKKKTHSKEEYLQILSTILIDSLYIQKIRTVKLTGLSTYLQEKDEVGGN